MPHEVVIEFGADAVTWLGVLGQVDGGDVLLVRLGVVPESLGVGSHAELLPGAGHDDDPHVRIRVKFRHQVPVLGVHPVGP